MTSGTLAWAAEVTGGVVHVQLIGPSWWVPYLLAPVISAMVALVAAYAAHRWALREQRIQRNKEKLATDRQAQADQNVRFQGLIGVISTLDAVLSTVVQGAVPPPIAVEPVVEIGNTCGLEGVLGDVTNFGATYNAAQRVWNANDSSKSTAATNSAHALQVALEVVKDKADEFLKNGQIRLNELDLKNS
jgi:hypothetical protein